MLCNTFTQTHRTAAYFCNQCCYFFLNILSYKHVICRLTEASGSRQVLGVRSMVDAIEFPSSSKRSDESPKQHVAQYYQYYVFISHRQSLSLIYSIANSTHLFEFRFLFDFNSSKCIGPQMLICRFLAMFSYAIRFLSSSRPRRVRFYFLEARDVHLMNRLSKFFPCNLCGIHIKYCHTNSVFRIWSKMVWSSQLSLSTISDDVKK